MGLLGTWHNCWECDNRFLALKWGDQCPKCQTPTNKPGTPKPAGNLDGRTPTVKPGLVMPAIVRADQLPTNVLRWRVVVMVVGWAVLCLARTGSRVFDSVWAEDSSVFLQDARDLGARSLLKPYNDYLHVVPRLLAIPASWVPLELAPVALSTLAALGMAVCACIVYWASRAYVESEVVRVSLGTYLVLLPGYGVEVANNLTYLQWPMVLAATWICMAQPTRRGGVFLALTALSAPQAIVLAPIVGWQAWKSGNRAHARPYAMAVLVQWGVVAVLHRQDGFSIVPNAVGLFIQRGLGTAIFGDRLNQQAWASPQAYALGLAAAMLATVAAFVLLHYGGRQRSRNLLLLLLGLGVAFFIFNAVVRSSFLPTLSALHYGGFNGARYFVPTVFLFGCAAILLVGEMAKGIGWTQKVSALAGSLVIVMACSTAFTTPYDLHGTSWRKEYQQGVAACAAGATVVLLHGDPLGDWALRVPCSELGVRANRRTGASCAPTAARGFFNPTAPVSNHGNDGGRELEK